MNIFKLFPSVAITLLFSAQVASEPSKINPYGPLPPDWFERAEHLSSVDNDLLSHWMEHGLQIPVWPDLPYGETNAKRVGKGGDFDEIVKRYGGSERAHLYDRNTGHLLRHAGVENVELTLASESGTQPLDVLHINYEFLEEESAVAKAVLEDFRRILERLPNLLLFIGVGEKYLRELLASLAEWPIAYRERVEVFMDSNSWPIWVHDLAKPVLLPRTNVSSGQFRYRAENANLAFRGALRSHKAYVDTTGGNIVVGDRDIFVGTMFIEILMGKLWSARSEVLQLLSYKFGKPVTEIGAPGGQVSFHLDLDLAIVRDWTSACHREVVLLQSPVLLFETLLRRPVWSLIQNFPRLSREDLKSFDQWRTDALRALDESSNLGESGRTTLEFLLQHADLYAVGLEDLKYKYYRKIISDRGYSIVDLPGTSLFYKYFKDRNKVNGKRRLDGPPSFLTYANIIASGNLAIVPHYEIPQLDEAAYDIMRSLGYEVLPARSTSATMRWNGGIRCLSETFRHSHSLCACELRSK